MRFSVWYLIISNKKQLLTEKIKVAIKRFGDKGEDQHCPWWFQRSIYFLYGRRRGWPGKYPKIMENSCIWESLEPLNFPWTLFSRDLVNNPSTLSPKIQSLEILNGGYFFNKCIHTLSHFDKGVLKNSRKAFFYIIYIYNI